MVIVEELADGTILRRQLPRRGVPTYGDWLKVLLARRCAYIVREIDRRVGKPTTGQMVDRIVPLDKHQEQACDVGSDGTVRIICIGCGEPTPKMGMQTIRIGGLVQLPQDETIRPHGIHGPVEIHTSYKMQPTSKRGLGCMACYSAYAAEAAIVDRENKERADIALAHMELEACRAAIQSRAIKQVKGVTDRVPFLDVFAGTSVTLGED